MTHSFRPLVLILVLFLTGPVQAPAQIPVVSSITPLIGPPGTIVTASGANFSPVPADNIVYIGAMRAPVLTASPTMLTVQVPPGCPYGPLSLTVAGRTATSSQCFLASYRAKDTADGRYFLPGAVMRTTLDAGMITMGDLDGDGRLDLLNSSQSEGSVGVLRNASTGLDLGQGALDPMVSFHTGNAVIRVSTGDVDGDGRLDILSANFTPYSLTVLRNVASPGSITVGSFVKTAEMVTGYDPMNSVAHDLDGDGRIDIAVQNFTGHSVSLFRNTSTGSGSSASSFSPRADLPTGLYPNDLAAGDLDGDGKIDLVVAAAKLHVHRNIASPGTLTDQSFAPAVEFTLSDNGRSISLGDVDNDGKVDLIVLLADSSVVILRNASVPGEITTASFASGVKFRTLGNTYSMALGDFNGDGKLDIAAPSDSRRAVAVLYNQHQGLEITSSSFSAPVIVAGAPGSNRIAAGDLNGDGRPDIALTSSSTDSVYLLRNAPPPISAAPQLLSPDDSATGRSLPVRLSWSPVRFAQGYHVQCALDTFSAMNTVLDTLVADTSALATALAYDTLYYWRVRGWNTTGYGDWATPFMFRTVPPIPTTPLLQSPPNSATGQTLSLTLAWRAAAFALSYHVKAWSTIDSLLWPLLEDTAVVDTQKILDTLRTGTWYSWTVRAKGYEGYGAWSPIWTFRTTVGQPLQVVLRSPASGTTIQGDTIRLTWHGGQPEVTDYWLEVGTDSLFAFKSIDSTVVDTARVVRGLQKGLRYWWRVRARNAAGWGIFSESRHFSVSLTGVEHAAEIPSSYILFQNYPNPFNPSTTIRYGLPRKSLVTLSVFNTLGQQITELVGGEQDAGFHEVIFDGSAFASAVYLYRLTASPADGTQAADFIGVHKFLLVK